MEELRIPRKEQFSNRLLKKIVKAVAAVFILFSTSVFAITPQEIQRITIKPEQNVFFTNQELKYVLEIPEIQPHFVQTQLQENMKEGVIFVSSRRMEYFTNDNQTGTRIEFWFTFKDAGIGTIPPLIVRINGRTYYLKFENVQIYENPKTIAPRLVVELDSTKTIYPSAENSKRRTETFNSAATKPIDVIVYVQYAVQIKQFGYEIPRDSIFEEVERYDMVSGKLRSNEFSQEKIPLARFKWTPLKDGKYSLPNIRAVATAYSGRNLELGLPECSVNVSKNTNSEEVNKTDDDFSMFAYALSEPVDEEGLKEINVITEADYYKIAALRCDERRSFGPSPSIRKQRIAMEQKVGIPVSRDEPSIPLCHTLTILFVLFTAFSIVFFIFKKKLFAVIAACLAVTFGSLSLIMGVLVLERHAVVKGGSISPIPENSALSSTAVTAGTCVRIKEETAQWYYIEYHENGGWIKKEELILVE